MMENGRELYRPENRSFFIAFHLARRFFTHAAINREDWRP